MPYEFPRDKVLPLPAPPVVKAQPLIDPDTLGKRSTNVACAIVYASILLHYVRAEALALATFIVSATTREHALVAVVVRDELRERARDARARAVEARVLSAAARVAHPLGDALAVPLLRARPRAK